MSEKSDNDLNEVLDDETINQERPRWQRKKIVKKESDADLRPHIVEPKSNADVIQFKKQRSNLRPNDVVRPKTDLLIHIDFEQSDQQKQVTEELAEEWYRVRNIRKRDNDDNREARRRKAEIKRVLRLKSKRAQLSNDIKILDELIRRDFGKGFDYIDVNIEDRPYKTKR